MVWLMAGSYAELFCFSNFTFLTGASHPHELAERALELGYHAIAITDACSVAGIPRAWAALKDSPVKLITGSWFELEDAPAGAATPRFILLAQSRKGYGQLCQLITTGRRRAEKGQYQLFARDIETHELDHCLCLWQPPSTTAASYEQAGACGEWLQRLFEQRLRIGATHTLEAGEEQQLARVRALAEHLQLAVAATGEVHMHARERQPLQDVLTALRHHATVENAGHCLFQNGERYLRPLPVLQRLFPQAWLQETVNIANSCSFEPGSLRYEYPPDLVPEGESPAAYLKRLTREGERRRYPEGTPMKVQALIRKELGMISELNYEHYFLTIHDIVAFARSRGILCQGRGSAANSAVCYCLGITEVDPARVSLLFERFISKERHEPPDIDVDFEHERREEVIQYIYQRYGRERAALAATVITYRAKSAIRDVGKALGLDQNQLDYFIANLDWRDKQYDWGEQLQHLGLNSQRGIGAHFCQLVRELIGFPRHLSQHVGGFVIAADELAWLVPVENAAMPERTVIQWDKNDLEALSLMKVDVLALGILSAIRRSLALISQDRGRPLTLSQIPPEDPATYAMLQQGDSIGVFQVESRAQINMLPRLRPENFYDLVVQVAIVRPGPILGDMVHPYLRRRRKQEPVEYPSDAVEEVLERTLGVPIFQEQVIKLAMVAAGFSGGEADQLRRAMAAWKRTGQLKKLRTWLIQGMLERGYEREFADRLWSQISGFGEYGFPESHAASFALLVYSSAWLKCHEPAAFYCALLNSQPMGFYSPSQLIQDARRHQVEVLPVDVNTSDWDHQLDSSRRNAQDQPAIRLGLRLVKGLRWEAAQRLLAARPATGYRNLRELEQRAGLHPADLETLASADALAAVSQHRYQARWDILGLEPQTALFESLEPVQESLALPAPSEGEALLEDYQSLGLSLGRHPLSLLREQGLLEGCLNAEDLLQVAHGKIGRAS